MASNRYNHARFTFRKSSPASSDMGVVIWRDRNSWRLRANGLHDVPPIAAPEVNSSRCRAQEVKALAYM
jgi:hypothetical protein